MTHPPCTFLHTLVKSIFYFPFTKLNFLPPTLVPDSNLNQTDNMHFPHNFCYLPNLSHIFTHITLCYDFDLPWIQKILHIKSYKYISNSETHVSHVICLISSSFRFPQTNRDTHLAFRNVQTDQPYLNIHYRHHFIVFSSSSSVVIFFIFFIIFVISLTHVILVMSSLSLFFVMVEVFSYQFLSDFVSPFSR